jgi:hypothetical protein
MEGKASANIFNVAFSAAIITLQLSDWSFSIIGIQRVA